MVFKQGGLNLNHWEEALMDGLEKTEEAWFETIQKMNLLNSVFVDITANDVVGHSYDKYLRESIAVVACNKVACSSEYSNYLKLKEFSRKYNALPL